MSKLNYEIKEIFVNNKERYGYRRINDHKKVYRIMAILCLKPLKRNKKIFIL